MCDNGRRERPRAKEHFMKKEPRADWDPHTEYAQHDQRTAYDNMRQRCPVSYSDFMHWSVFRHADLRRVLADPQTFSNAVSQHLSVPNGMDAPEHTAYRRIIEPYFSAEKMQAFEPVCRNIVVDLVERVVALGEADLMAEMAAPFAARVQCAFLGWPAELHETLIGWTRKNYEATLAQDRQAMSEVAREFERLIDDMLERHREADAGPDDDVTASLLHEEVWGRPLSNEEIASILRNWTVGEIGTISASVGILAHFLSHHPDIQARLRNDPSLLPAANDEILRIYGPLVASRRVTTCPVELGGRSLAAGERLSLMWIAANRDPEVFPEPDTFRLDRDPDLNLLYGAGVHVCPGAPLARMELRVVMEELLARTSNIAPLGDDGPTHAAYPGSGFATLPLRLTR